MEPKWTFLNIKKVNYENLNFEEKKNIAKETWFIERLADRFECKNILALGDDTMLKIKDEVIETMKKDNTLKAQSFKPKVTNGLLAIKKHLGS